MSWLFSCALEAIMIRSCRDPANGRWQTYLLLNGVFLCKGARKGEKVNCKDAHLETVLSLRHLGCWLWEKKNTGEKVREREREQTTIVVNYLLKGGSWPSRAAALYIYYIYFPVILDWWNRKTVTSARAVIQTHCRTDI